MISALLVTLLLAPQTLERRIDLADLGWGALEATLVETDGNPDTEEWLVKSLDFVQQQWRVIAVRPSGLCMGEWFDPRPDNHRFLTSVIPVRMGRVDKLRVEAVYLSSVVTIVKLDTPRCH